MLASRLQDISHTDASCLLAEPEQPAAIDGWDSNIDDLAHLSGLPAEQVMPHCIMLCPISSLVQTSRAHPPYLTHDNTACLRQLRRESLMGDLPDSLNFDLAVTLTCMQNRPYAPDLQSQQ